MPYRLLLLFSLLLGGCGQKGPLYLPSRPAPAPEAAPRLEVPVSAELPPAPSTQSSAPSPAAQPE